jgi:SAM-dependent methyltransferase
MTERKSTFDQASYWNKRHEQLRDDPRSVGNLGKSLEQNRAAELRIQQWVAQAARILKPYSSVLDVGCGYGRVAGAFCDAGYAYTGIDISPVAISAAQKAEPRGSYFVGSPLDHAFQQQFNLVCVLYVFVHFVDDGDWKALISKLAGVIGAGGGLLFADSFPRQIERPAPHVAQRPLSLYVEVLSDFGLRLDPLFREELASALGGAAKLPPVYLARAQTRAA